MKKIYEKNIEWGGYMWVYLKVKKKRVHVYIYSMRLCASNCFKHFFKHQENTLCLLSSLCSWALAAFQSKLDWQRPGHGRGKGKAACDWREAEDVQCAHTCRQTHTLLQEAVVGSRAGRSYKATPQSPSRQTEVSPDRGDEWMDQLMRRRIFKQLPQ